MGKRIKFKGIVNFRELGDFNTINDQLTQNGRIYRSSMLFADEAADVEKMKDLGIQTSLTCVRQKRLNAIPISLK
uniref:tyrosine-protein phosphatase n=1 Tax=Globicatella sulfidifaciens TaxID=136093 RepID=UPI0023EFD0AF